MMNEETFKICVRAYFPDAEFVELHPAGCPRTVEVLMNDEWFHTIHWEDFKAKKFVCDCLGEKELLDYLKRVKKTGKMYDKSKVTLPLDVYGRRGDAMRNVILGKWRNK